MSPLRNSPFDNGVLACHAVTVAETSADPTLPPLADPLGKSSALVLPHLRLLLLEGRTYAERAGILDLPARIAQLLAQPPLTTALTGLSRDAQCAPPPIPRIQSRAGSSRG